MGLRRRRPSIWARLIADLFGRHGKLLPDSIVDEIGDASQFRAHLCTREGLREACDLTRDSYGDAYVSDDVAEQWRLKNPFAFVQIMDSENRLCACFGVLALRQRFMDPFIKGFVSDKQLGGEDVCSLPESKASSHLYLSGIVVLEPTTHKGHKRTAIMLWAMLEYIRRLYDLKKPRQLYAVAVTREASQLMKNFGFKVETLAAHRRDNCDLYRYDLNEASWNTLLCKVNDWSRMCILDLALPERGDRGLTTIVFVAGDRGGFRQNHVQINKELNAIEEAVRSCTYREQFDPIRSILSATHPKLVEAYRHRPAILHFAGHGDDRSLSLYLEQGSQVKEIPIAAEQLAAILRDFPNKLRLCVLNTCSSATVAKHLVDQHVVDAAIGWPAKVDDSTAITFSRALYSRLGDRLALPQSVRLAAECCVPAATPILYTDESVDPEEYFLLERIDQ